MVHDELLHVLVVDVHQGVEHVPEVPESNCNRFLLKKIRRNDVSHGLLLVLELHDDLLHVLVVDVHQGVHEKKNLLFIKDAHSSCPYLSNKKKLAFYLK